MSPAQIIRGTSYRRCEGCQCWVAATQIHVCAGSQPATGVMPGYYVLPYSPAKWW